MQVSDYGTPKCLRQSPSRNTRPSEPMSPESTQVQMVNSSNRQFVPGFLMGDLRSSPQNGYVSPLLKSPNQTSTINHPTKTVQARLSGIKSPTFERSGRRHASPPTQSLWSSANQRKNFEVENMASESGGSVQHNLNISNNFLTPSRPDVASLKYSSPFQSPIQMNSLDVSRRDGDDETATWVTVFGYDQAQANSVLQHFSHIGTIEKYVITNGGNWMNIKYANKIQARCALNRNGRVLDGKIMIGVRKCTDLSALNSVDAVSTVNQDIMTDRSDSSDSRESLISGNKNGVFSKPSEPILPAPKLGSPLVRGGVRNGVVKMESSEGFNQSFCGRGDSVSGPIRNGSSGLSRHSSMRPLAAPYQPPPRCQVTRANQFQTFKIDFLIPELFKDNKQTNPERPIRRYRRLSNVVNSTIRAIRQQSEENRKQSQQIHLEIETRNRVKTLLASAKNGSFGTDEPVLSQKKSKKLENLSKELFDTEKRYLESLRILKEASDRVQTIESDHKDALRDVFKEIPSLHMLHGIIDSRFYKTPDKEPNLAWFIQIFTSAEISPFMNIYRTFLSRVGVKYETLQYIYEKDKLFQQFCQSLVLTSQFSEQHTQSIPGMYIGIQSRLMRYQLLLQKISDLLLDEINKERCDCALKITINVLKSSEEEVSKNEMISKAILINSKLEGRKNKSDKLSLFIRSGPCLKIPRRSVNHKPLNRHLFLFSDYLILTDPEVLATSHYMVKSELTIVSMIVKH
ncbi:unnamed protein product [Rodentolepis nana]|uniref:Nucleoporin NUP35 n=1 Tax=Rodentolepis nana TaxID=102285 RepID=A0A0R3TVQ5_RODNA|nr:unnamed protein product [Rodentolepis nana]